MKDWLLQISGAKEEIRKLRQKVEYQERWISERMAQEKVKPESHAHKALRVMQRRAARLMDVYPEIYREFFSKDAKK